MNILVIGSTSRTGLHVLQQGKARGHHMTAFTRRPELLKDKEEGIAPIQGDGLNPVDLQRAVQGQDAVVAIVSGGISGPPVVGAVAANVVEVLRTQGPKRVVWVSAYPIIGKKPWPVIYLVKWILRKVYADLRVMEGRLAASGLDWTVIRPPRLVDAPAKGRIQRTLDNHDFDGKVGSFSRGDLAAALLDALEDPATRGHAVNVC